MFIRISFVTFVLAVAALGVPVKRDPTTTTVTEDFMTLDRQTKALTMAINEFPNNGGTLVQVYDIHEAAETVDRSIKTTTEDTNARSGFTNAETQNILNFAEKQLVPDVLDSINALVQKKDAVSGLSGAANIAKSDLDTIKTDFGGLQVAMRSKVPTSAQGDFMVPFTEIDMALDHAISVYS